MDQYKWYEAALAKVNSLLPKIDRDLTVRIVRLRVETHPGRPFSDKYSIPVLFFRHRIYRWIQWKMRIEESWEFIENRLENIVKICLLKATSR